MTRSAESLLGERMLPVRLAVLTALAAGCLLLLGNEPTVFDWATGLLAVLATALGVRRPMAASLLTTGLLVLGFEFGHTGPIVAKVAAAFALGELTARRGGRPSWPAAGGLGAAYLLHPVGGTAVMLYRAVVMAVLPLFVGGLLRSAWARAEQSAREADALEQRRASEIAAARETERTAIARELHDLIAHHVSSTVLRVGVARHAVPDAPPALLEVLDDIHSTGKQTLTDLRKLVTILRDPAGDGASFLAPADLPAALTGTVERARRGGLAVTANVAEDVTAVDALRALTVLRLTQEGLANVVKHAGPEATVWLTVSVDASGELDFTLRDNGSPRPDRSRLPGGVGLIGLRERVELLDGVFDAGPNGSGWRITARLPRRIGAAA
ncbi:sensor histidine kinase [Nocardia sp. NPDC004151]|uniref:sensor histidine kinase n=1 Tax=Nocardia sp. NPDC004151 TaxID=3364304 RepID=UPI00367DC79B